MQGPSVADFAAFQAAQGPSVADFAVSLLVLSPRCYLRWYRQLTVLLCAQAFQAMQGPSVADFAAFQAAQGPSVADFAVRVPWFCSRIPLLS